MVDTITHSVRQAGQSDRTDTLEAPASHVISGSIQIDSIRPAVPL